MGPGIRSAVGQVDQFTKEVRRIDTELERTSAKYQKAAREAADLKRELQSLGSNPAPADVAALRGRYAEAKDVRATAYGGMEAAVANKRDATEREMLRERLRGMEASGTAQYQAEGLARTTVGEAQEQAAIASNTRRREAMQSEMAEREALQQRMLRMQAEADAQYKSEEMAKAKYVQAGIADISRMREREMAEQVRVAAEYDAEYKAEQIDKAKYVQAGIADVSRVREREIQAERASVDQKNGIFLQSYNTRVALENKYFELTASKRDIELNRLREYYGKLRGQYAGNAQMVAQIDKTYMAEQQAAGLNQTGGGFWGPIKGRGRTFKAVGRMATVQAVAGAGPPEVSQASGFGMMSYMSMAGEKGALAFGAAVGGIALAAYAFAGSLKQIADTRKQIAAWTKEEEQSARNIRAAFDWKPDTTGIGRVFQDAADRARAAEEKAKPRAEEYADTHRGVIGEMGEGRFPRMQPADYEQTLWRLKEEAHQNQIRARQMDELAEKESVVAEARRQSARAAEREAIIIQGMVDGPLKERASIEHERAQNARIAAEASEDITKQYEIRLKKANDEEKAALRAETLRHNEVGQDVTHEYKHGGSMTAAMAAATAENATWRANTAAIAKEAEEQRARASKERDRGLRDLGGDAGLGDAALAERERQATRRQSEWVVNQREATEQAVIEIEQEGTTKQLALLELRHRQELREYEKAGLDTTELVKQNAIASRQIMENATGPLKQEAAQLGLQIAYSRGEISREQMDQQSMIASKPGATEEEKAQMGNVAAMRERARLAEYAKGQKLEQSPMAQYKETYKDVTGAVDQGLMSEREGQMSLRNRIKGLVGGGDMAGGSFEGGVSHWQSTQSAIMKGGDVPAETLAEIRKLVTVMQELDAKLTRDGVKLGA